MINMPPKKPSVRKVQVKQGNAPPSKSTNKAPGAKKAGVSGVKKAGTVSSTNKGKGESKASPTKQKVWTKQDDAARTIQTSYRKHLARKALERKKKEKEEYEALMDKLEKEAFVKLVKMQQEQADKERQAEEEERKRKAEHRKRMKRMLEASYDGDNDEIFEILKEVSAIDDKNGIGHDEIGKTIREKHQLQIVECEDANENTPLSEAANGGNADIIQLLLDRGANPNTQGQFRRTPLYRAAFAGHLEACQVLLQNGADPRLYAADGQNAEQIASVEAVREFIASWDICQTELLLSKIEAEKERRIENERKRSEAEQNKLEEEIRAIQKEYDTKQKQLDRAYCELNKRISEHDTAVASGFERTNITIQAIHDAETEVEIMKIDFDKVREKLAQAKLKLREKQMGDKVALEGDTSHLPGVKVMVRELDDVLLRDVGNKIKDSGKWPLLIDTSGQAATFLRYRDTNYFNALRPADMDPPKLRLGILGAIRFGKPVVLDMMEVDMFETVADRMDEIQKGFMNSIMDKSILRDQNYLKLVKEADGEEYAKTRFNDLRAQNFRFFIVTKNPYPPDNLIDQTYPIRVYIPM